LQGKQPPTNDTHNCDNCNLSPFDKCARVTRGREWGKKKEDDRKKNATRSSADGTEGGITGGNATRCRSRSRGRDYGLHLSPTRKKLRLIYGYRERKKTRKEGKSGDETKKEMTGSSGK